MKIEPYSASFNDGIEFLVELHHNKEAKYDTVAGARSALSAILQPNNGTSFGKDPIVSRTLKGMFKLRPRLPKHTVVYDTDEVLQHMNSLPSNKELLLERLTKKLVTLLCILSGQRSQSISSLYLSYMHRSATKYVFYIPKVLKTTTPSFHQEPLEFEEFMEDEKVCVVDCLEEYILRTECIRENIEGSPSNLILSYAYPHQPVKSATLARYVTHFLGECGIDLTVFSAHSTRKASTSKANNMGLSLKDISKAAGWKGTNTFQKHYKLPIRKNFGTTLLKAFTSKQ